MNGSTVECVGGALDGLVTSSPHRLTFLWINGMNGGRCHPAPGRWRYLYRLERWRGRARVFVYAGHTHAVCSGCSTLILREPRSMSRCPLCGSALELPEVACAR